jgi:hypothetical protein
MALSPRPGPECEADHSSPSSVKVKNMWNYTSTPPVCFYGLERHNLTCYLKHGLFLKSNGTEVRIHTKETYFRQNMYEKNDTTIAVKNETKKC